MAKVLMKSVLIPLLVCLSFGASAHGGRDGRGHDNDRGGHHHGDRGGKRLVLQLLGTGNMYESTVPDIDGDMIDDPAMCFDIDLVDFSTNRVIGSGTDCFANVTPIGSGLSVDATMFLNMPEGTIVIRTKSSAQPVIRETIQAGTGVPYTHLGGASANTNGILDATGRFEGATGTVRFSGLLNMDKFNAVVGDPVLIDCIFVINLD